MVEDNEKNNNVDLEVVSGNGKDLKISPVYDHIKIDKPSTSKEKDKKNKQIIVPKSKNSK